MQHQSRLSLLEHFVCIAERCPDNCCHGWDVPVDGATYQGWQALAEDTVKQTLQASIDITEDGADTRYTLLHNAEGNCVHLAQTGLCYVQQRLSHAYLPRTCREYPRVQVGSETFHTATAYLSCPEIARLVVTDKNVKALFSRIAPPPSGVDMLAKVVNSLEKQCHTVLPIPTVPSGVTLCYLVSTVLELMHGVQQGTLNSARLKKIANMTGKMVTKKLESLQQAYQAGKLRGDDQGDVLFWSFVVQLAACDKLPDFRVLLEKHGLDGFYAGQDEVPRHASYLKLRSIIENSRHQPGIRRWESSLRRYLIVKLRNHDFPHAPVEGNFLVNLLDCSVAFATIQLWLWLLLQEQQTITEDELVTVIYKVERTFIHNDTFYQHLNENPQLLDMSAYLGCLADLG